MIPCHDFLMVRLETEGTFPYGDGLCSMISAVLEPSSTRTEIV